MVLRPENLPRDPDRLIEMVLACEGKIEALQATITTLKTMIFGARSEKSAVIIAEQMSLGLGDVETNSALPAPANDDHNNQAAAGSRNKRNRNIGALPENLTRCDVTIEPETTACPCCAGALHRIGEDVSEVLDKVPAILRVSSVHPSQIRVPGLRGRGGSGQGAPASDRERHGLDSPRRLDCGGEVRLGFDAVSPGADPCRPWPQHRSSDAGSVDEAGGLDGEGRL